MKGKGEKKLWKLLSPAYMSDEETDSQEGGFIIHHSKWRSKAGHMSG